MGLQNFPDVYTSVTDNSFTSPTKSRFHCGLVGPAQNGPVNVATPVNSVLQFEQIFGQSLPGSYLCNAVQLISNMSDGVTVVRIAHQYTVLSTSGNSATGTAGASVINTPNAPLFQANDYVRVFQPGLPTTVNARVISADTSTVTLDGVVPLQATYTGAEVDRSRVDPSDGNPAFAIDAANNAEAFLNYPVWGATPVGGISNPVLVSGTKSAYQVNVTSNAAAVFTSGLLTVGSIVLLQQAGLQSSTELLVASLTPPVPGIAGSITFQPVNRYDIGYQAVPLQDSYTAATITLMSSYSTTSGYHLLAVNPGTWANSDGVSTGLIVNIKPGSNPNTKKIQTYLNSALVEEIDNVSSVVTILGPANTPIPNPNYIGNAVNGVSQFIQFVPTSPLAPTSVWLGAGNLVLPANTRNAFLATTADINIAAFQQGFNGENVVDQDYIGTVDPVTALPTGLKIFEDIDNNLQLDVIAAPGVTSINVFQEMDRINREVHMVSPIDTPAGLNILQANDWLNGTGPYTSQGTLDTYTLFSAWNWGTMTDTFSGDSVVVPASIGALRCMAYTFDAFKPSFAAAGETRGLIPEFTAIQYPRLTNDQKQATYRNGNVLNPILVNRNRIMFFGNQTMQRANSKFSSTNNVVAVNTILRAMYQTGRRYIFDPLDDILLAQMYQDFKALLGKFKNDRFIEDYGLTLDNSNNSAADRNNRQANVDFSITPIDALEKLFVNATVTASGTVLNSVS